MSNKTSDKNAANVTKNDIDILNALIYVYEARLPNYNELMDSEVKSLKNILADYTRQKQLNEEHKKVNGELRQAINTVEKEKGEWIEECQQKDKQIQELEEENAELLELKISVSSMNTIQNLEKEKIKLEERCFIAEGNLKTTKKELRDYFYNSIPKQTVIDKIEELKKQISIDICIENNLEKHYELKYKIEVLQELLEGEK